MAEADVVSAKALYEQLATARDPYLKRARRAAELTVPHLFPKEGSSGSTTFEEPNQSLGARGLRHLASKLQITLFPVNAPFFKYTIDELALANVTQGATDQRGEVEKALSARERAVISVMNSAMFRPVSFEVFRQLLLAGNSLLHIPKKGRVRAHKLSSYVVRRDASGNLLDIVILEQIARTALPDDILARIAGAAADSPREATVELYTKISLDETGQKFIVTQEIDGEQIDGDYVGEYPKDKLPWLPLRFTYIEGEDYGRGFIDEYIGDLNNLDKLTEALRDGTIQGAKVIWLVKTNSTIRPHQLSKAQNGGFVQGNEGDVVPLRLEKQADFAVAERLIDKITERLSYAFLLNSAVQRNGDRVTAEEIRYIADELDQGMGGVYSLLTEEFQMPVATLFSNRMEHERKVPPLPRDITSTSIVTGMDALGRGNDLSNLDQLIAGAAQMGGPEVIGRYVNLGEYFKRRGASLGVDMNGLIRTDEEIAQADQQAQLQAMAQNLGPQALQQMGQLGKQQMVNDAQAEQGEPNG